MIRKSLYYAAAFVLFAGLLGYAFSGAQRAFATTCDAGTPVGSQCIVFLTTGSGNGNQSWSVPADWNNSDNQIACIGSGGTGLAHASTAGAGGGGGAYASTTNVTLSGTVSYAIGASATTTGNTIAVAAVRETYFGGVSSSTISTSQGVVCDYGTFPGTNGVLSGSGGKTAFSIGITTFAGGNGGSVGNTSSTGGGGAAGMSGAGLKGGNTTGAGSEGGSGGGGANGGTVGSANSTTSGGAGGQGKGGTGSGPGGAAGVGGTDATAATGAGGGGSGSSPGTNLAGKGSIDTSFDATHGAGGGGGGAGSGGTSNGADGGIYGGGGGGVSSAAHTAGKGGQGIIVIIYTPISTGGTPDSYTILFQ